MKKLSLLMSWWRSAIKQVNDRTPTQYTCYQSICLVSYSTCFDNNIGQLISCLLFYDVVSVWYISYNKANTSDMPQLFPQCSIASGCGFWHLWQVSVPFTFFSPLHFCVKKYKNCYFKKTNSITPFCRSWHLVQCTSMYVHIVIVNCCFC